MFNCQVCGKQFFTDTAMGEHLRSHGVNLFPEVMKLNGLINRVVQDNRALLKKIEELESRLRIIS